MIDYNVVKRGLNYHGANSNDLEKEQIEIKKEQEKQEREKAVQVKNSKSYSEKQGGEAEKEAEKPDANKDEEKAGEVDEEREGVLKMVQVQNLPDDADMIIGQLKTLDFAKQDLDVLIALSKTLKNKRINLFPESQYAFTLQDTGLTNEEFEKANQDGDAM